MCIAATIERPGQYNLNAGNHVEMMAMMPEGVVMQDGSVLTPETCEDCCLCWVDFIATANRNGFYGVFRDECCFFMEFVRPEESEERLAACRDWEEYFTSPTAIVCPIPPGSDDQSLEADRA